jgi:hypothetical protein
MADATPDDPTGRDVPKDRIEIRAGLTAAKSVLKISIALN